MSEEVKEVTREQLVGALTGLALVIGNGVSACLNGTTIYDVLTWDKLYAVTENNTRFKIRVLPTGFLVETTDREFEVFIEETQKPGESLEDFVERLFAKLEKERASAAQPA